MTFLWWQKVICWLSLLFVGRGLNLWQIAVHGFLPIYTFWGDWIPIAQRWLVSIGDVLQLVGIVAIILATLLRYMDERYVRAGGRA